MPLASESPSPSAATNLPCSCLIAGLTPLPSQKKGRAALSMGTNSEEVVKFLSMFHKLEELFGDNPSELGKYAASDSSVSELALDLWAVAGTLRAAENRHSQLFSSPTSSSFIKSWRKYEADYFPASENIFWSRYFPELTDQAKPGRSAFDIRAEYAAEVSASKASAMEVCLEFAQDAAIDGTGEFYDKWRDEIIRGVNEWKKFSTTAGLNIEQVIRKRMMIPFVLIPTHVSSLHGEGEKLSLFTRLKEAQNACVFGLPLAAIALMRSIVEVVLTQHYGSSGTRLEDLINNCQGLPRGASKGALHRLRMTANDVLHRDVETPRIPKDIEREVFSLLLVVRELIEGAPTRRGR